MVYHLTIESKGVRRVCGERLLGQQVNEVEGFRRQGQE